MNIFPRIGKTLVVLAIVSMILLSTFRFTVSTITEFNGQLQMNSFIGAVYAQGMVPITGAWVSVTGTSGSAFAVTDSSGRYLITDGLGTGSYSVTVMAKGYIDKSIDKVQVVAGQETSNINFFLKRSGAISGKVTGPDNKPVKGVLVYAMQISGTGGNASSYALTAEDGSYIISSGLSTGTYNVTAGFYSFGLLGEKVGYVSQTKSNINVVEVQETSNLNFKLEISGAISGRVTATGGTPLVGVMVAAASSDGKYFGFAYTDVNGNYKIATNLGTGIYTVFASKGMVPAFIYGVSVTAGQETANIDFQISILPSGSISGRVTDTDGNPIKGASVSASGPAGYGSATTDNNGYYAISEGLGTGSYTVSATAPGYSPSSPVSVSVTVNQETKGVDFQLQKISGVASGRISGQVTGEPGPLGLPALTVTVTADPSTISSGGTSTIDMHIDSEGTPVTGATVALTSDKGGSFSSVTDHGDGTYSATFTGPTVTTSTLCVVTAIASKDGYASGSGQTQITVQPSPALSVTVTASPATVYSGGTSTIKVSVTTGTTAITGATVGFTSDKGGVFSSVTDLADGTYTATFTTPDVTSQTTCTITASASKSGYTTGSGQARVTVQPLVLNIYVKDASGNPLAGTAVVSTSQPSGQASLSGTTDANGLITFTGILKGSYTMKVSKSGYEDSTWTGTVAGGQVTTQTITLTTPFPWTWVVVGVVVVGAVVGAVLAIRMRKPKA